MIGDPVRWLGLDDDPPPSAGFPRRALDAVRDRAFGEVVDRVQRIDGAVDSLSRLDSAADRRHGLAGLAQVA